MLLRSEAVQRLRAECGAGLEELLVVKVLFSLSFAASRDVPEASDIATSPRMPFASGTTGPDEDGYEGR